MTWTSDSLFGIFSLLYNVALRMAATVYVMFIRKYKCIFEDSEVNIAAMDDSRGS